MISSHVLTELEQIVDDVLIINRGRLVVHAPLADILRDRPRASLVRGAEHERLAAALRRAGLDVRDGEGDAMHVDGADPEAVSCIAAQAGVALRELRDDRAGLSA